MRNAECGIIACSWLRCSRFVLALGAGLPTPPLARKFEANNSVCLNCSAKQFAVPKACSSHSASGEFSGGKADDNLRNPESEFAGRVC